MQRLLIVSSRPVSFIIPRISSFIFNLTDALHTSPPTQLKNNPFKNLTDALERCFPIRENHVNHSALFTGGSKCLWRRFMFIQYLFNYIWWIIIKAVPLNTHLIAKL